MKLHVQKKKKKELKTLRSLFMDEVQLSQGVTFSKYNLNLVL